MKCFFIKVNILILALLLGACGGDDAAEDEASPQNPPTDSQPDDQTSNEKPAVLLIKSAMPSSGFAGGSVILEVEGADRSTVAILNGVTITPNTIDEVDQTITFLIPDNASSGPLKIVTDEFSSNAIWFSVGKIEAGVNAPVDGVMTPVEGEIVTDDMGNTVAIAYLLVSLSEGNDTRAEADRLAALASGGEVVGRISLVNGWQIKVDAGSLAGLQAIKATLEGESTVEYTVIDIEIQPDAADDVINWAGDPDRPSQRSRNKVEEGVALYKSKVSPTASGKVRPFFMSIGVSEAGIDYKHADFSGYARTADNFSGNVAIYANQQGSALSKHGSNVTGVIAAELGDKGNAGPIRALSKVHGGAIIHVGTGDGSWSLARLAQTEQQIMTGAQVINWSWGIRKEGGTDCSGASVTGLSLNADMFADYSLMMNDFFSNLDKKYPNVVIVTSAGNDAANAGDGDFRLPSSIVSDQLLVVGAHTTKGSVRRGNEILVEDDWAGSKSATSCYDTTITTDVKRADYSNYGSRVDIAASGSIIGLDNELYISTDEATSGANWGTSYAAPLVTATVALMQSINPDLRPIEIKSRIRQSALPIENKVVLNNAETENFTRVLSEDESSSLKGKGARLNIEGAIKQALNSLNEETLPIAELVTVTLEPGVTEVTEAISVTIPSTGWIFDKVDIMFLVDVSFSYADDLKVFSDKASDLIDVFSESGANVQIGLSSFSDFPQAPFGAGVDSSDYAYRLDQALTSKYLDFNTALVGLSRQSGGDFPESQLEALFQVNAEANEEDVGWRPDALPVIFLATDALFHNSDNEPAYPGAGLKETIAALVERGTRIFGLQSGGTVADVVAIANATGGEAFTLSRDSKEIVEVARTALAKASTNISVVLETEGDLSGLVQSITPSGLVNAQPGDAIPNVKPGNTIKFDIVFNKGILTANVAHTFSFRFRVIAEDVAVIQNIPVTVIIKK
ncbi:MAG: S8 family serine peptidase [Gammaproteobacteria bacterium]|nr:S8 family serine peptidase [Gammaproteobacteria bacterium]